MFHQRRNASGYSQVLPLDGAHQNFIGISVEEVFFLWAGPVVRSAHPEGRPYHPALLWRMWPVIQ